MKTIEEIEEKLSVLFQAGQPCPDCELTGGNENCPTNIALAALKAAGDNWKQVLSPVSKLLFLVELQEPGDKIKTLGKLLNEFDQSI